MVEKLAPMHFFMNSPDQRASCAQEQSDEARNRSLDEPDEVCRHNESAGYSTGSSARSRRKNSGIEALFMTTICEERATTRDDS